MKNKTFIYNKEFRQFRTKIFIRTMILILIAMIFIFLLYRFVLYGNFANWMVDFFQNVLEIDYYSALNLYTYTFRENADLIMFLAIVLVFFVLFSIYLNWFTKYFEELNSGIDALINEDSEEISLSPELLPMERKMNTIKHTIEKQKTDMQLSEQRKNDLIMYLAHDLKTPLASVIGYLNLLHDESHISEELKEKYISITLDKAERLEELINEFFEITRFNLSDITLQYSRINLTRLLEQLIYEFAPMFKEKNLNCNLNAEQDIMLKCDADKIQRVFDNLLRNAVIYSFNDTDIDITAERQDENLVIKFVNHGNTIPKEKMERIFEQFYRLDASRSTGSGGAGLGLAVAKHIVEIHKGIITARSKDELIEFVVILPLIPLESEGVLKEIK